VIVTDIFRLSSRLVTVVGSAQINEDDPRWEGAFDLGRRLADAGWTVVTGGYRGLMAAAARGAKSVDGATIGLPISSWTELAPDESHDELWWCENFSARAAHILSTRAVVVLDGGVGTLSELAIVWSTAQTEASSPLLFLVGEIWHRLYPVLTTTLLISANDAAVPVIVSTNDEVVRHLAANLPRRTGSGPRG
jgi:uncharacterized protein (TIGR00730 family)